MEMIGLLLTMTCATQHGGQQNSTFKHILIAGCLDKAEFQAECHCRYNIVQGNCQVSPKIIYNPTTYMIHDVPLLLRVMLIARGTV
jgi:hypothetical protein